MEFVSIGGRRACPPMILISVFLNRNPANMFHRLNYIESYGTGIRRIFALYAACHDNPETETPANNFKIILPNMNSANPVRSGKRKSSNRNGKRSQII